MGVHHQKLQIDAAVISRTEERQAVLMSILFVIERPWRARIFIAAACGSAARGEQGDERGGDEETAQAKSPLTASTNLQALWL
jgi:hypothetical protein